ncbi:uracil-DNA glycosylase [uncultured Thiohalocapsa sp.]|uniref:uracil-DNA glycosylase n=1 Tax=uncultured Thiohalocapsa sp. TaxID=768990 RepID=UPI0025D2D3FF|nr:uracil-DNA glycosylase [uncultured Thiohalocapsa sp.]
MNEARRIAYLNAMGIDVWRLRRTASDLVSATREVATGADAAPAPGPAPEDPVSAASAPATTPPAAAPETTGPASQAAATAPQTAPQPAGDEPPPWTDADLAGLPSDDDGAAPAPEAPQDDAVAAMDWPELEAAVAGCRACGLCERRTNTVFGVGDRNATVMFVGEGPGADEDRKGEPFVGRAGQLLNRMLAAAGFRREQVYIANVVKCRPPNNRDPSPDEAAACRAYLQRQIALVQPRLIVCLGRVPSCNLLDTTESLGRLRGRLHRYGPTGTPLLVTYHPSYYLRSPEQKAKGWQDLQRMLELLDAGTAPAP